MAAFDLFTLPPPPNRRDKVISRCTGVFWDNRDYPIPLCADPAAIKEKITDYVRSDGYTEDGYEKYLSICLFVDKATFPPFLVEAYSGLGFHIYFIPEDDDGWTKDMLILRIVLWAFKSRAPANLILVSKTYGLKSREGLSTLSVMGFNLVLSDPPEAPEVLGCPSDMKFLWPMHICRDFAVAQAQTAGSERTERDDGSVEDLCPQV